MRISEQILTNWRLVQPLKKMLPAVLVLTLLGVNGCGVVVRGVYDSYQSVSNSEIFHQGRHGDLTAQEQEWARAAWHYFERNVNLETGLVNSIDGYPSTTLWHIGDSIAALVSARELKLIDETTFDARLSQILHFLNSSDLFFGRVPNKAYHTVTGRMVNYTNKPEEIGWSAVDLGRLLIWLHIVRERYPQFGEYVDKAVLRCNFCDVVDQCGALHAGVKVEDDMKLYQEGRLGYEEYSAKGYQAWGFDTRQASLIKPFHVVNVLGIELFHDARDPREAGTFAPIVSLPYLLQGLEFNWDRVGDTSSTDRTHTDPEASALAQKVYLVQEKRFQDQNILTARTDHPLSHEPYFVHDSIFGAGYAWETFSDAGTRMPEAALVSTRAVFGMWALWKTPYTDTLMSSVGLLFDPKRGWYEGRREQTGGYDSTMTSTTNAVVLEALLYKKDGKIFPAGSDRNYYKKLLQDTFKHPGKCFPPHRKQCL